MTTTVDVQLDPTLQEIIRFAPMMKKLFTADVMLSISDLEKIVFQLDSKELDMPNVPNRKLTEHDPMVHVMQKNTQQSMNVGKEFYGSDINVSIVPITNEANIVVGSIAITSSIQNREDLVEIAEEFTASSEEIGASTVELSSTALSLSNFMETISTAQDNLAHQVNDSSKILDMINSVAKSTRILGLNAGIEAARSGEHGRGFSVVAKEITKLADQSANAVNEIRQLLDAMKEKVETVSQTVSNTLEVSEAQTTSIHEISNAIKKLTEVAEKIDELAQKV